MELTGSALTHLLGTYGYVLLLPLSVFEGPIVTILAGVVAAAGKINILGAYILLVTGDLIGDALYYQAGKYGRTAFAPYWTRLMIGRSEARLAAFERRILHHGWKTLVVGKYTQPLGALVLLAAGAARMPLWKFMIVNLLATLPKSLFLLLLGYYWARAYIYLFAEQYGMYIGAIGLAAGVCLLWWFLSARADIEGRHP